MVKFLAGRFEFKKHNSADFPIIYCKFYMAKEINFTEFRKTKNMSHHVFSTHD